jgi:hypothetical protein
MASETDVADRELVLSRWSRVERKPSTGGNNTSLESEADAYARNAG